jgi:hypothetical protein
LEVTIEGKMQSADAGSVMFFASNDFHHVKCAGTVPAMCYAINMGVPPKTPSATSAPAMK